MARPINSARGLFGKLAIQIGSFLLDTDSTGVVFSGGVKISDAAGGQLKASATALLLPTFTALPSTRQVGGVAFISNSTGKRLAFHSTGTTWKYIAGTSVLA